MNNETEDQLVPKTVYVAEVAGMTHSPSLTSIGAALAAAQGEMSGASKSADNPYFKSRYADLAAVIGSVRGPLSKNKIAHIQSPGSDDSGPFLDTLLVHASGEWIRGRLHMKPVKNDPQGIGSVITYLRRYALQAMLGLEAEDDDGNGATHSQPPPKAEPKKYRQAADDPAVQARIAAEEEQFALEAKLKIQPKADSTPKTGYPDWCDYIKDCGTEHKGKTLAWIALNHADVFDKWVKTFKPMPGKSGITPPAHLKFREQLDNAGADPMAENELAEVVKLQEAK